MGGGKARLWGWLVNPGAPPPDAFLLLKGPQLLSKAKTPAGFSCWPVHGVVAISKLGTWCPLPRLGQQPADIQSSLGVCGLQPPGEGALFGPPWGSWAPPPGWGAYLIVHLLGAVEDINHGAQGPAQVFRRLCLACPGWASGGSTHDQVEGLGQGYVAPARDPLSTPMPGPCSSPLSFH